MYQVPCVQVTSHLKLVTRVQVSLYELHVRSITTCKFELTFLPWADISFHNTEKLAKNIIFCAENYGIYGMLLELI